MRSLIACAVLILIMGHATGQLPAPKEVNVPSLEGTWLASGFAGADVNLIEVKFAKRLVNGTKVMFPVSATLFDTVGVKKFNRKVEGRCEMEYGGIVDGTRIRFYSGKLKGKVTISDFGQPERKVDIGAEVRLILPTEGDPDSPYRIVFPFGPEKESHWALKRMDLPQQLKIKPPG